MLFVDADRSPTKLDRGQHDVVNTLFRKMIFLMIGEDFEHEPLDPFGRWAARPCHRPGPVLEFAQTPLADRFDDGVREKINSPVHALVGIIDVNSPVDLCTIDIDFQSRFRKDRVFAEFGC